MNTSNVIATAKNKLSKDQCSQLRNEKSLSFLNDLYSTNGANIRVTKAGKPGICGKMVVFLAIILFPDGFSPMKLDTINREYLFCGSSSIATEFTLSGSIFTDLKQNIKSAHF